MEALQITKTVEVTIVRVSEWDEIKKSIFNHSSHWDYCGVSETSQRVTAIRGVHFQRKL